MLTLRCTPATTDGIDPSAEQLSFARRRPALQVAQFRQADAMSLPFPDNLFDAAVMPLVIFFVPDPARGVAEMARVVSPGGIVAAYAWDLQGGGFPYERLWAEMRAMGVTVPLPPSPDAGGMEAMQRVWTQAGLQAIETRQIMVERTFENFDDYWVTVRGGPSVGKGLAAMGAGDLELLKERMRAGLAVNVDGGITCRARANAVKGRVDAHVEHRER